MEEPLDYFRIKNSDPLRIRILPTPHQKVKTDFVSPFTKRPIERYLFHVVALNEPDKVKILSVGKGTASQIFDSIMEPPPKKSFWRRFWEKLHLAGLMEKWGILEPPKVIHYDFDVSREIHHDIPSYKFERISE